MLVPMLAVLALPGFVFLTGSVEGGGSGFKERGGKAKYAAEGLRHAGNSICGQIVKSADFGKHEARWGGE